MSTDVDFIKMNKKKLQRKVAELIDDDKTLASFRESVTKNIEETSFKNIIEKIEAGCDGLSHDEIAEFIGWLHCIKFKTDDHGMWLDDEISEFLQEYGFDRVMTFRDNNGSFRFPCGNFMSWYYNDFYIDDFEKLDRHTCNLKPDEFYNLIDYLIYHFGLILIREGFDYISEDEIRHDFNTISDEKLKRIAEKEAEYFISNGKVFDGYTDKNYGYDPDRGIYLDNIMTNYIYCTELKKIVLNNDENMIMLIL
jgi:hypothetical protein